MAKGTRYSDVNFSVPEGADPLGIGVPDLGRSSYDPLATIRAGWAQDRQKRAMKDEQRRQEYQSFMEDVPTFDAINQKVVSKLNEKAVKMGELAYQKYKSGAWSPFARTEEGGSTERELSKLQNEIIQEGQLYNAILPKYQKAEEYVADPKNAENIDWDLTKRNMSAFTEAEDIQGMTQALNDPLVVLKPDPVELNKYLDGMYSQYIPGEDQEVVSKVFNEDMNKWEVQTQTYKNPERVISGMRKIYRNMEDKYRNEVNRRFEKAPRAQKVDKEGVPIDAEDWFISQYVPEYAKKMDLKTYAGSDEKKNDWSFLPGQGEDGRFDLSDFETVEQLNVKTGTTAEGEPVTETREYNSAATIGLQSISRMPFVMSNTPGTINAESGEKAPAGRSTTHLMDKVSIMPVATNDIVVPMSDGTERQIKAGEMIPKVVQREMAKNNQLGNMKWDAFITTLASNKQVASDQVIMGINLGQDISSFTETQIRPWKEASKFIRSAAMEQDVDISPLEQKVEGILQQMNNVFDRVAATAESQDAEKRYENLFN